MTCEACGQPRPIAARGLCRTCYSRWQRGGTVDYIRPIKSKVCSVEGCMSRVHGQGLCNKHLLRLRRTGTVEEGRPYTHHLKDPAALPTTHDLYPVWAEFIRSKNRRPVEDRWLDFNTFISEVAPRPGRRWRIYGLDRNKPLGPDNYIWREAAIEKTPGEDPKDYAKRQRLAHREMYPDIYKDQNLRRSFGPDFGIDQYIELSEKQDHKCAICLQPETLVKKGRKLHLAVDHNHATKKIRELLCHDCNTGIGKLREDSTILQAAIAYLAKHAQQT